MKQITAADGVNKINLTYTAESYRYAYRTSYGNNNVPNSANGKYAQNLVDLLDGYRLNTITSVGTSSTGTTVLTGILRGLKN